MPSYDPNFNVQFQEDVPNPGGPGDPGTVFNRPPQGRPGPEYYSGGYDGSYQNQSGNLPQSVYNGQSPYFGRYRPPMMGAGGANDWMDGGGYAYNLPNSFGPYPFFTDNGFTGSGPRSGVPGTGGPPPFSIPMQSGGPGYPQWQSPMRQARVAAQDPQMAFQEQLAQRWAQVTGGAAPGGQPLDRFQTGRDRFSQMNPQFQAPWQQGGQVASPTSVAVSAPNGMAKPMPNIREGVQVEESPYSPAVAPSGHAVGFNSSGPVGGQGASPFFAMGLSGRGTGHQGASPLAAAPPVQIGGAIGSRPTVGLNIQPTRAGGYVPDFGTGLAPIQGLNAMGLSAPIATGTRGSRMEEMGLGPVQSLREMGLSDPVSTDSTFRQRLANNIAAGDPLAVIHAARGTDVSTSGGGNQGDGGGARGVFRGGILGRIMGRDKPKKEDEDDKSDGKKKT